jgi:hypothetical protein
LGEKIGVMECKRMGQPCTVHFRIDVNRAIELIEKYLEKSGDVPAEKIPVKKEKPTSSIDYLRNIPDEDIKQICGKYRVEKSFVLKRADDVIDYCEAKGKKYSDYRAALRNFIKSHLEKHPENIIRMERRPIDDPMPSARDRKEVLDKLGKIKKDLIKNGTLSL